MTCLIATQMHPFKSVMHSNTATLHSFLLPLLQCLSFPVCLAAEVLPQRAAHRAGEEGRVRCSLPEREIPFLMYSLKAHCLLNVQRLMADGQTKESRR